jgi:hypothetical protein
VSTLDHVGYVSASLSQLRAQMARLGFAPTEPRELMREGAARQPVQTLQQQSCHAVFGQGYLEFSSVLTEDPGHHLAPWRSHGAGVQILALGTRDIDHEFRRCEDAGIVRMKPAFASRAIDYGARRGQARFHWFMLDPQATPEGLICYVDNLAPELVYQPEVMQHPNGACELREIVISIDDMRPAQQRLQSLLGVRFTASGSGRVTARLTRGALTLATAAGVLERFGAHSAGLPAGRFAAVVIAVKDLAAAHGLLMHQGVPARSHGGALVISPSDAGGALLVFEGR